MRRTTDLAVGEEALRMYYAAERHAFHQLRIGTTADDQLGAAAADINHQPARPRMAARIHTVSHAVIDQARFFDAGDDADFVTERFFGGGNEGAAILQPAQRVGTDHAHAVRRQLAQTLTEALKAGQGARLGLARQLAVGAEAGGEAHGFTQPVQHLQLAVVLARDQHVETVGAEIDRGHLGRHRHTGGFRFRTPRSARRSLLHSARATVHSSRAQTAVVAAVMAINMKQFGLKEAGELYRIDVPLPRQKQPAAVAGGAMAISD